MEEILQHWPFIAATLIFAAMGQFTKKSIFTTENIIKYKKVSPWRGEALWWGKKSLPLHPVLGGIAMSLIPGMPVSPGVTTQASITLYFAFAGIASTWAFNVVKSQLKERGIEIDSDSVPPPGK
jgi:hypothetical protein